MARPEVTLNGGKLRGTSFKTPSGFSYNAFSGIRYAQPPLGNLRFKDPQPLSSYSQEDATAEGNMCSHFDVFFMKAYMGEEDCLFLNVYVPEDATAASQLPVMFWIHGGAFCAGSGTKEIYGPDYLVDKNVILVTINYRLGPLGFLCLNTPEVPGNAGLKDQVMALKWVNDNIKQFGGDSDNITIFGESAGASSVHYLLLSPLAKGLFTKAILESGSSFNAWSNQSDPIGTAFKLGELLQLKTDAKDELHKFFMDIDVKTLVMASANPVLNVGNEIAFSPVVEQVFPGSVAFLTENPKDAFVAGKFEKVPTISGFTSNEGVLFAMKLEGLDMSTLSLDKLIPDFTEYIPNDLKSKLNPETTEVVVNKIKDFYFASDENLVVKFFAFMTDYAFVKDIDFSVKFLSQFVPSTYYYRFSFNGSLNIIKVLWKMQYEGAAHADDLGYLFKMSPNKLDTENITIDPQERDIKAIKQMTEMWTNFAKTSNPTPRLSENIKCIWEPIQGNVINCLNIDEECTLVQDPFQERIQFWVDLYNI